MKMRTGRKTSRTRRIEPHATTGGNGQLDAQANNSLRLPVAKTYKIYIGGKFPRSESGRSYPVKNGRGQVLANACLCSRKDFRDSVVSARAAQAPWAAKSAFNRGQILYRIAEMLEGRAQQFVDELHQSGLPASAARNEVAIAIDRLVYYAGWADKFQQVFSSVNAVSSSHFCFSLYEPVGVVSILAPEPSPLLGLVSVVAPTIVGGNACIVLASSSMPLPAITFAEVLATSDLPGGVVNILTGQQAELLDHFASHKDVNACIDCGDDARQSTSIRTLAAGNVKRILVHDRSNWASDSAQAPRLILDTQELKTTWHPVGI
jgi:acyl-CoA reductase-like NAD-dependent aldehyde dehydrogenase